MDNGIISSGKTENKKNDSIRIIKWIGSFSLWHWCVFFLLIFFLAIRIYHLGADPPIYLSSSGGLFGDEAALAQNARNKILFGNWITDGWNPIIYNPIFTVLEYLYFSGLGVGLIQLRLVNISFVFFSFILLFSALKEDTKKRLAVICILLLGSNYIFIMYSRLGLNDTFLVFPLVLTLFLWQKGLNKYPILFLAGVSSFACYVTKASALYFIVAVLISLSFAIFKKYSEEKNIRVIIIPFVYFLSGLCISLIFWYIFFFIPLKTQFASVKMSWFNLAIPSSPSRLWNNLTSFTFLKYMSRTPIELILSWCYAPLLIYDLIKHWKKVQPLELLAFLWLIGGYLALNGLNYRPLRYFIPLIPPLCISASFFLDRLWKIASNGKIKSNKVVFYLVVYASWIYIFHRYCIGYHGILKEIFSFLVITAIVSLLYFVIQRLRLISMVSRGNSVFKIMTHSAVISIIILALTINGSQYIKWAGSAKYSVINISEDLGRMLDRAYIAGLWSPLATIENEHKALYVGNRWFNYRNTFKKYPITHLFLWDGNNKEELRFLIRAYPKIMKKAKLLKTYRIKGLPVRLFEIKK